jgi:hypothetical protein
MTSQAICRCSLYGNNADMALSLLHQKLRILTNIPNSFVNFPHPSTYYFLFPELTKLLEATTK